MMVPYRAEIGRMINRLASSRRLWVFRVLALGGSLTFGGGAAWLGWRVFLRFAPTSCERTAAAFDAAWEAMPPTSRALLAAAGYGRDERLVLAANFDGCLVFSGQVMEPDARRGYRFRPDQRNLLIRVAGLPYQVLVPDTPAVREGMTAAGASVTASERINSLGCRGPEVGELHSYAFRVLILGDSFAEGILVEEPETFCSRLEQRLSELTGAESLVVNSGVIGYSTEQEYYTLVELAPQVRPRAAVLCFYANDVHYDHHEVLSRSGAAGDWSAARKWLDRCAAYCRAHGIRFMVAAIPDRTQVGLQAGRLRYQHRLAAIADELGIYLVDPHERFTAHRHEPLWWEGDAHFAAAGHTLFAEVLSEHLKHGAPASGE